jgi:hypothetical protein
MEREILPRFQREILLAGPRIRISLGPPASSVFCAAPVGRVTELAIKAKTRDSLQLVLIYPRDVVEGRDGLRDRACTFGTTPVPSNSGAISRIATKRLLPG